MCRTVDSQALVEAVKGQIYDVFLALDAEEQEAKSKTQAASLLEARRGIEKHFEKIKLVREIDDWGYDLDDWFLLLNASLPPHRLALFFTLNFGRSSLRAFLFCL